MSDPRSCDLLVRADMIVTQDDERTILRDGGIVVTDGLIVDVDSFDTLQKTFDPASTLDLSGKMLLPGLVNGHTHLPMTVFRGFADDLPLMEWLEQHIWPVEFQLTEDMLGIGAMLGCAELIRSGCTSFLNGYFHEHVTGDVASACGMRSVLGEGFFGFPSPHFPTAADCWESIRVLHARYLDDPLVGTAVTPHAAFTVSPEILVESHALACKLDIPWQIHLAESPAETAICLEKHGKRPVAILNDEGLLSERTTLHHCVDLTDEEIELLADTGVNIVHNPTSNMKLCSGMSPVQKLLDAGATIGLGTDGAASNNQLNMFREMAQAALIGKIRHDDASAVGAQAVLDMATRGAAKCIGQPGLGQIRKGAPADIVALDLSFPNMMPLYNPVSHSVYAATGMEVCMTMVAGQVLYLYDDFKTLDVTTLRKEAERVTEWVLSKAKK